MANQSAEMISIKELNGKIFYVPAYQRGFRWSKQQVLELIEDLYNFVRRNNKQKIYSLQPIVVKKRDDNIYELIDGQQRLTAIYILLAIFKASHFKKFAPNIKYTLLFEGKEAFEELLNVLNEEFKDIETLNEKLCQQQCRDIDSKNVINIIKFISSDDDAECEDKLCDIFRYGLERTEENPEEKDICIIWHEIGETDEYEEQDNDNYAIDVFANINANKIPLTESELIKAVILHRFGDDSEQEAVAHQWETIERGLSNDKVWYFFMQKNAKYETRIDLLFEVWYEAQKEEGGVVVPKGTHELLRAVNKYFEEKKPAKELWDQIVEIFETIQDWYNDYEKYHLIGLLAELYKGTKTKKTTLPCKLYREYHNRCKSEFCDYLRKEIFSELQETKIFSTKNIEELKKEDIVLGEISYDKTSRFVKKILLTYNIALLVNSQLNSKRNTNERFPFDYYRSNNVFLDIEHINPQTPDENKDMTLWLEFIRCFIDEIQLNITDEQKDELKNGIMTKEMQEKLKNEINMNEIGNLVLLDSKINRSPNYANCLYSKKRVEINKALRGQAYFEAIILPGTRLVFNREFETDNGVNLIWTQKDQEIYKNSIEENLYILFKGELMHE